MAEVSRPELLVSIREAVRAYTARAVLYSQAIADQMGLNATDARCLDILSRKGPITAGQLAELTGLTSGAVTGVIDRLEKPGYVRRVRDAGDRRRVIIEPIPEHELPINASMEAGVRTLDELLEDYSDEQLAVIHDFLRRSVAMTERATAGARERPGR
ncbi:MarR family transcriptional regulator [Microbispora sp. SCL1-1]|uniref:MarR family winged helix-turn-helix transcriptional regulator n=1 Tax=Microbispora TaxID=2005 RepID=UPI001157FF4A|nr:MULTISPECIES: MarR family transcriptional regulator [unclassified Microbispora]NJP26290.1 MarR family transcriptional regulator [Microbispora sp. CL1-1]TQS12391.1 MarR family transcriptional regulator [Microbispora sp. SCL1-1]